MLKKPIDHGPEIKNLKLAVLHQKKTCNELKTDFPKVVHAEIGKLACLPLHV